MVLCPMNRVLKLFIFLFLFSGFFNGYAQQQLANQLPPVIERLDVEFEGIKNASVESALAFIKIRAGMPYNQILVDQSIRALYSTGNYDYIEVRRKEIDVERVAIIFILHPKYRIQSISFEGNCAFKESKLKKEIESKEGETLSESIINQDASKLFTFYQQKGYSQVAVTPCIQKNPECGTGTVILKINEGSKIKIKSICFTGTDCYTDGQLEDQIRTKTWNWLAWLTGRGRYEEEVFYEDLNALRRFFMNEGYLDVKIEDCDVTFEYPDCNSMVICINVHMGERYYIGNIIISGNTLFETCRLEDVLKINSGDVCSPLCIDESSKAIRDFYGQFGYLETFVQVIRLPNIETGNIDIEFKIKESDKFYVETIHIQGNTKTKSTVILRELALAPGDVFDTVRMDTSKQRLENTRFFDQVTMGPETTNIPGRKNLRIAVQEAKTGFFHFGAGFSTLESLMGTFEFTQSNFDLFNYRTKFQGGGQKFKVSLSAGTKASHFLISYENPWIYERRLAFGFEIYRDSYKYVSSLYNEQRTGFDLYLRKRLFELVEGRASYGLEWVRTYDVSSSAPVPIQQEAGSRSVSKGRLSLLRDTRDNFIFPNEGSRCEAITELAGGPFGGQTNYFRLEGRAAKWWSVCENHKQVFSVAGRTGTVSGFNNKQVPYFDRYFLGGPDNMRGFNFQKVGPKSSNGEPVGGDTYGFLTVEYSFEVMDPLRMAGFYDIGFVDASDWTWDVSSYNSDIGFGFRLFALGAPLRLDFGFPLRHDQFNKNGMRINFSVGIVF